MSKQKRQFAHEGETNKGQSKSESKSREKKRVKEQGGEGRGEEEEDEEEEDEEERGRKGHGFIVYQESFLLDAVLFPQDVILLHNLRKLVDNQ